MSITIDPTVPADSESPRQGAARIRQTNLNFLSLFSQGGGSAVTFANPPFSIDTSGNVTIPTTLTVPTPLTSTQAAQLGNITTFAVQAPVVTTTLVNTTIAAGANALVFSITTKPPGTTQLYRALVTSSVYFQGASGSGTAYLSTAIILNDNSSLFTSNPSAEGYISNNGVSPYLGLHISGVSNATRTGNAGLVTFTIQGYNSSASTFTATLKTHSDLVTTGVSYLSISWIPAQ